MTTPDESPIIRTSSKRMAQGLAIVVIVMAVGAAIAIPNWHNMAKNPPPVSTITTKPSTEGGAATSAGGGGAGPAAGGSKQGGTVAGATTISILQGAAIQGNPAYDPATLTVKKGDNIQVANKDNVPHTVTNGKGPDDPNSGKLFDTSIINGGESAKVPTTKLTAGEYPYHCTIHPYMTGTLKVQ